MTRFKINVDEIIEACLKAGETCKLRIEEDTLQTLTKVAKDVFFGDCMLLELDAPVKICGDVHGQYHDLLRIFNLCGFPSESNKYLFLGDYVDRGKQSLETIVLLLAFKIKFPDSFFLLRGNHECASINRIYGFYDECKRRYTMKLWKCFCNVFEVMPVSALVGQRIFCMHGGLSPALNNFDQIKELRRPTLIPTSGLLCDLLWADPDENTKEWAFNSERGVSHNFGVEVVANFLQEHDLDLICRAHQVVEDGYEFFANQQLVTIFSAPNYSGEYDNVGAILTLNEDLMCSMTILKPFDCNEEEE